MWTGTHKSAEIKDDVSKYILEHTRVGSFEGLLRDDIKALLMLNNPKRARKNTEGNFQIIEEF